MDCFKAICAIGDRFQVDSGEKRMLATTFSKRDNHCIPDITMAGMAGAVNKPTP